MSTRSIRRKPSLVDTGRNIILWSALSIVSAPALADQPGVGLNAEFERDFLRSIINHHYSGLRMTELAVGTDPERNASFSRPQEGVARTPDFAATPGKAEIDKLKSISRMENRMMREEIMTAQRFLREWYGMEHEPTLTQTDRTRIRLLEDAEAGEEFDHFYMEVLSRHHYGAVVMANQCLVAADLKHEDLTRYCSGIAHNQISSTDEMRHLLCEHFGICDYQPLRGLKGRHTGSEGEPGGSQAE